MSNRLTAQLERARKRWRIRTIHSGKWFRERGQRGLSAIPHLFTLVNLACGIFSIMLTIRGDFRLAALMVAGSLVADGLDGRLARIFKADGEFGKELDSLADIVSFGTAPAILLYELALHQFNLYGVAIALVFPMCGALRLARFNIIKTSGFFLGVPITAAGTLLSTLAFYTVQESTVEPVIMLFPAVVLLLSYLMISAIPYPDFKKRRQRGTRTQIATVAGPVLVTLVIMITAGWNAWAALLVPLAVYVSLGPWLLLVRHWSTRVQPWLAGGERR